MYTLNLHTLELQILQKFQTREMHVRLQNDMRSGFREI